MFGCLFWNPRVLGLFGISLSFRSLLGIFLLPLQVLLIKTLPSPKLVMCPSHNKVTEGQTASFLAWLLSSTALTFRDWVGLFQLDAQQRTIWSPWGSWTSLPCNIQLGTGLVSKSVAVRWLQTQGERNLVRPPLSPASYNLLPLTEAWCWLTMSSVTRHSKAFSVKAAMNKRFRRAALRDRACYQEL